MTNFPTLFQPATGSNITAVVNEQANTLAQLQQGVKPLAPNFLTANARRHSELSTQTFFTFPAAAHVWSAQLTFTIATTAGYAGGVSKVFADLTTGSGFGLLTIELSVAIPSDHDSDTVSLIWNGLPIANADTLVLNLNNAVSITGLQQQASCIVGYAIP